MIRNRILLVLLMLVTILSFICSCGEATIYPSYTEATEHLEPQHMAYHLGYASRLGDDIYLALLTSSDNGVNIVASEYGTEDFTTYVPCFDAVCDHKKRARCCLKTYDYNTIQRQLTAFLYDGEPSLVIFSAFDTCLSMPYSNVKTNLILDDFLNGNYSNDQAGLAEFFEALNSAPQRSVLLIYGDYLYYAEIKDGSRTQYRIPLTGGNPERVFEEDNIIIKTIINDKFYGIRYDIAPENPGEVIRDRDRIHYFRSDMNYENIETLPEILDFFSLVSEENKRINTNAILDADEENIYVLYQKKIWAISDSDIHAEPVLLSDPGEKLPSDLPKLTWDRMWYNDGVLYIIINTNQYNRQTLDSNGFSNPTQWYESSTLYSFDISTGECKTWDIKNQSYLIMEILYADDEYVYAIGRYVHNDNRAIEGVTIRLTIDTMRYEVILPDRFWEYSAETTAN